MTAPIENEADARLLYSLLHNGREWGGPGASTDRETLRFYGHVADLFLSRLPVLPCGCPRFVSVHTNTGCPTHDVCDDCAGLGFVDIPVHEPCPRCPAGAEYARELQESS